MHDKWPLVGRTLEELGQSLSALSMYTRDDVWTSMGREQVHSNCTTVCCLILQFILILSSLASSWNSLFLWFALILSSRSSLANLSLYLSLRHVHHETPSICTVLVLMLILRLSCQSLYHSVWLFFSKMFLEHFLCWPCHSLPHSQPFLLFSWVSAARWARYRLCSLTVGDFMLIHTL